MKRIALVWAGHASVLLGLIGIALPVLPTTPFLILACFCYRRGSPALEKYLQENRWLGPFLSDWQKSRSIKRQVKAKAIGTLCVVMAISMYMIAFPLVRVILAIIAFAVIIFIATRPSPSY